MNTNTLTKYPKNTKSKCKLMGLNPHTQIKIYLNFMYPIKL